MNNTRRNALLTLHRAVLFSGIATAAIAGPINLPFPGHVSVERPAAAEFGFGPRASANRTYKATLQPTQPLRLRQLQTLQVRVSDASGRPVEGARISVDGGMPEHGHGLPTQPLVRRSLGGGVYEIEGLRFSMGGWWELKLAIDSPSGSDRVTFNISL